MAVNPTPLPTIALQGISSYFDRKQVFFKTILPHGLGDLTQAETLLLDEGERHGEIEVLEINEHAGTVRFRNHGQEQLLWLHGSPSSYAAQ